MDKERYKRIKNVLLKDKNLNPARITNVLKAEIAELLSAYMVVDDLQITVGDKDGFASVQINVLSSKIYSLISSM